MYCISDVISVACVSPSVLVPGRYLLAAALPSTICTNTHHHVIHIRLLLSESLNQNTAVTPETRLTLILFLLTLPLQLDEISILTGLIVTGKQEEVGLSRIRVFWEHFVCCPATRLHKMPYFAFAIFGKKLICQLLHWFYCNETLKL